jgi:hypothetical protein
MKDNIVAARADAIAARLGGIDAPPALGGRYLVKGLLDRGSMSVMFGESNVGKTFVALDLALHVAAGADWHGRRAADPGDVLYVAAEGGGGFRNRLAAFRQSRPEIADAAAAGFHWHAGALDLFNPIDARAIVWAAGIWNLRLVVIDTLARCIGDGDENTAKDMGRIVTACDHIRAATQSHVMVIHHSGKDASRGARGSGSLRAACDTEIELARDGATITGRAVKQRDMGISAPFAFTLRDVEIGTDEDGDGVTSAVVDPAEPVTRKPKLAGAALVAAQALDDALVHHGTRRQGPDWPPVPVVSVESWRAMCDRHGLTGGATASASRTAFMRAKASLMDKGVVRIFDGMAWRCS